MGEEQALSKGEGRQENMQMNVTGANIPLEH